MILFRSRSQLSLSFFLILIRLPSSLVYNGIIPDSSILYPDFIREYYSSLTLNRIMPRLIRMFIRGITYLSVRSLNLLVMKTTVRNIIDSNMKQLFIGCYLEYFCSKLMTRFWRGHLVDTYRRHLVTLLVFFWRTRTMRNNTSYDSRQLLMCMFLYFVSQFKRHGHERCVFGGSASCFLSERKPTTAGVWLE